MTVLNEAERNRAGALAWVVVGLCFLALGLAFSARAALGLVMPLWSAELGWTRSFISGAGAAALMAMADASLATSASTLGEPLIAVFGHLASSFLALLVSERQ